MSALKRVRLSGIAQLNQRGHFIPPIPTQL
jgi:hypothetical protein